MKFQKMKFGVRSIEEQLLKMGHGSQAIIFARSSDKFEVGHAFNAININGKIHYMCGQEGGIINPRSAFWQKYEAILIPF